MPDGNAPRAPNQPSRFRDPAPYLLGYSEGQFQHLLLQGKRLRPITKQLRRRAGLQERVLDIGCAGDVTMLAAGILGRSRNRPQASAWAASITTAAERVIIGSHRSFRNPKFGSPRSGVLRSIIAAAGLLAISDFCGAAAEDRAAIAVNARSSTDLSSLPVDHPEGTGATVKLVSVQHAANLVAPLLSTFLIEYEPGGSAILHRRPSSGYVLVHILSGSIRAKAWHAGVGRYSAGQTWVQHASANDVTSENASSVEPARALVILITGD